MVAVNRVASGQGAQRDRIGRLAAASANFGFLLPHLDLLVLYGAGAESVVFRDPNSAMVKARQFGEALAGDLVRRFRLQPQGDRQVDRLHALDRAGVLHGNVHPAFDQIRSLGNDAVHKGFAEQVAAFQAVKTCFALGVWFDRLLTGSREQRAWVPPAQPRVPLELSAGERAEHERLNAEYSKVREALAQTKLTYRDAVSEAEAQLSARQAAEAALVAAQAERARLQTLLADLKEAAAQPVSEALSQRPAQIAGTAARDALLGRAREAACEPLNEAQVREELDRMLRKAGWSVQDNSSRSLNLYVAQGVAVREMTLRRGRADYLLYVDGQLVGVIEAKREGDDLLAAEQQAARYVDELKAEQQLACWRSGQLPFRYASDGGRTLFRNTLDPESRSRRVFWFHRPETLALWMRQADDDPSAPTFRARMRRRMPPLDEISLRPAQREAVERLERSHWTGRTRSLIQMATGAGKTYTAATFCYRLAKHAQARKILFLVDRNSLGAQAKGEFDNYKIPGTSRYFPAEYNVQRLATGEEMRDSTLVVVSTVQRLWMALAGRPLPSVEDDAEQHEDFESAGPIEVQYNPGIPPETFDLIVIDECHRSIYGKWRQVLEYFDAHLVGLTATPVAQTMGFFERNLVSQYTEEQAVADGVNVPFEVYRIRTEITEQGATIEAGTTVPKVDRRTRREKFEELEEDFTYQGSQVGSVVLSLDQIRLVIRTFKERLYTDIFPERAKVPVEQRMVPKTLIFARDDEHAEKIVAIVQQEFNQGPEFCQKITYKAKKAGNLINEFRTGARLRIAVTVDMISTGTDVKPLECLLFLRDIKTWSTFQQFKGRGTRTISSTDLQQVSPDTAAKTRFVLVDAIGVTEHSMLDAAPLDKDPKERKSLEKLLRAVGNNTITPDEVSTLAARLAKLHQQLGLEEREELERAAGKPLTEITRAMVDAVSVDLQEEAKAHASASGASPEKAVYDLARASVRPLAANPELRAKILELRRSADVLIDEVSGDTLLHAAPVVATEDECKATVRDFRAYLREHADEIAVFQLAYQDMDRSPVEVRARLRDIANSLARPPRNWTPARLWDAYERVGIAKDGGSRTDRTRNAADLISLIRYELGEPAGEVRGFAENVLERYAAWLLRQEQAGVRFNETQRWWLDRIVDTVARDVRFDEAVFDVGELAGHGGADGYIRDFGSEEAAVRYLDELNRELAA
ncbi:DEAD/DEAH box helicase family protein [Kitasatospora sp. NPDC004614]|uniref:DEAD/DEAH box helicase family protein n=1 Tax=unclassified Kitasatospora TaxID=2633591 RepID=UPI00368A6316